MRPVSWQGCFFRKLGLPGALLPLPPPPLPPSQLPDRLTFSGCSHARESLHSGEQFGMVELRQGGSPPGGYSNKRQHC